MVIDASPEEEDAVATGMTGVDITIVVTAGGTGVVAMVGDTVCEGEAVGDDEEDKHPVTEIAAIRIRATAAPDTRYLRACMICTESRRYINMP